MYKHILIAIDGSELSMQAAAHAIALAKALNAKITAVTVSTPFHVLAVDPTLLTDTLESYKTRAAALAAKCLGEVRDKAVASTVTCDNAHVEHEQPYLAIIDTANKKHAT